MADDPITPTESVPDPDPGVLATPPVAPDPTAAPTPALEKVNIGGVEYEVSPEVAQGLAAQQTAVDTQLAELRAAAPQTPTTPAPTTPTDPDYAELMYSDPAAYTAALKAEIRGEVVGEVTAAYNQDKGQDKFWTDFYVGNEDLSKHRQYVSSILVANQTELMNLPIPQASKRLSELSREGLISIAKDFGGGKPPGPKPRTVIETPSTPGEPPAPTDAGGSTPKVVSLTSTIKARARARRAKSLTVQEAS